LDGPVPITSGTNKIDISYTSATAATLLETANPFADIISRIKKQKSITFGSSSTSLSAPFPLRCCNIVDPVNESNNLGYNVTIECLDRIEVAVKGGQHHLDTLLRLFQQNDQHLSVAPALSLPFDRSAGLSAFAIPNSFENGTSVRHVPPLSSALSGPVATPLRPRAESNSGQQWNSIPPLAPFEPAPAPPSAAPAVVQALSELPPRPPSAVERSAIGGGDSEFLTVFFAQCRSKYVLGSYRPDLLDHPKQTGTFYARPGMNDRTGSAASDGRRSGAASLPPELMEGYESGNNDRFEEPSDPLMGNLEEMWEQYIKACKVFYQDPSLATGSSCTSVTPGVPGPSCDPIDLDGRTLESAGYIEHSSVIKPILPEPVTLPLAETTIGKSSSTENKLRTKDEKEFMPKGHENFVSTNPDLPSVPDVNLVEHPVSRSLFNAVTDAALPVENRADADDSVKGISSSLQSSQQLMVALDQPAVEKSAAPVKGRKKKTKSFVEISSVIRDGDTSSKPGDPFLERGCGDSISSSRSVVTVMRALSPASAEVIDSFNKEHKPQTISTSSSSSRDYSTVLGIDQMIPQDTDSKSFEKRNQPSEPASYPSKFSLNWLLLAILAAVCGIYFCRGLGSLATKETSIREHDDFDRLFDKTPVEIIRIVNEMFSVGAGKTEKLSPDDSRSY
jgi:hypothetical protein